MKKKLQRDFTTQEQSLRLLELGVPADSANCTLKKRIEDGGYSVYWIAYIEDFIGPVKVDSILPCWSVGRLIEILEIILGSPWSDHKELGKSTLLERVLRDFEDVVKYKEIFKDNRIDFSKLE